MSHPHEEFEMLGHVDQTLRAGITTAAQIAERAARTAADRDRTRAASLREDALRQAGTSRDAADRLPENAPTGGSSHPLPPPPTGRPGDSTPSAPTRAEQMSAAMLSDAAANLDDAHRETQARAAAEKETRQVMLPAYRANPDRGVSPTKATTPEEAEHRRRTWRITQATWAGQQPAGTDTRAGWDALPMSDKTDLYWKQYDTPQARTVTTAPATERGVSPSKAPTAEERHHREHAWTAAQAGFAADNPGLSEHDATAAWNQLDWQDKLLRYWTAYDDPATIPTPAAGTVSLADAQPSRERILALNAAAADWFTQQSAPGSKGRTYLEERLGTAVVASGQWQLGYAPAGWTGLRDHLRRTQTTTDAELVAAGLGRQSSRGTLIDVFRDRAMIGIRDTTGAIVGFVGRDLSGAPNAPRYLNTGETLVYKKGDHLLGLYEAPSGASLYRVEGPFDAIALTAAGEGRAAGIAPLGTALSSTQADALASSSGGRVWEALDNDPAGRHATAKDFWALTDRGVDVRGVHLPGSDPAEIWQRDPDQLRRVLAAEDTWPSAGETVIDDLIDRDRGRLAMDDPDTVNAYRAQIDRITARSPRPEQPILNAYASAALDSTISEAGKSGVGRGEAAGEALPADPPSPGNAAYNRAHQTELTAVHDAQGVQARRASAPGFSRTTHDMLGQPPGPAFPGARVPAGRDPTRTRSPRG
ncbi:MAG: toprim domain-containing protein [Propionibacterium sp.]|nr:toprim domain-containing protein [Propionibacterium sp.]